MNSDDRNFIEQLRYGVQEVRGMMDSILRDEADEDVTDPGYYVSRDSDEDEDFLEARKTPRPHW